MRASLGDLPLYQEYGTQVAVCSRGHRTERNCRTKAALRLREITEQHVCRTEHDESLGLLWIELCRASEWSERPSGPPRRKIRDSESGLNFRVSPEFVRERSEVRHGPISLPQRKLCARHVKSDMVGQKLEIPHGLKQGESLLTGPPAFTIRQRIGFQEGSSSQKKMKLTLPARIRYGLVRKDLPCSFVLAVIKRLDHGDERLTNRSIPRANGRKRLGFLRCRTVRSFTGRNRSSAQLGGNLVLRRSSDGPIRGSW